ncbi:hypothetical protein GCK32_017989 [Trichostrongylus colubriformis]|uniref:Uncharacterized protein n=1 Tax=Trichostrongylus colubriformis TaxID=6319 RepID=A0AAN8FU06_TRICO
MKSAFITFGLLAIAAIAYAEETTEEKKELSESGVTVLEKLRALRKEEESLIAKIENDSDREFITNVFKKEIDAADNTEIEAARVKRAAGGRRAANRRANRRRFARRLRRNQRRAAQKRRAHARRHQRNLRRAARKIRRIQRRG